MSFCLLEFYQLLPAAAVDKLIPALLSDKHLFTLIYWFLLSSRNPYSFHTQYWCFEWSYPFLAVLHSPVVTVLGAKFRLSDDTLDYVTQEINSQHSFTSQLYYPNAGRNLECQLNKIESTLNSNYMDPLELLFVTLNSVWFCAESLKSFWGLLV